MKEYIMPIDDTVFDWDEMFVGVIRQQEELIRCKDCKRFDRYTTAPKKYQHDGFCQWWARDTYLDYWCCGAERREE